MPRPTGMGFHSILVSRSAVRSLVRKGPLLLFSNRWALVLKRAFVLRHDGQTYSGEPASSRESSWILGRSDLLVIMLSVVSFAE